jgi:ATP-dependent exoDNAse (exonuclease V) beta subunit
MGGRSPEEVSLLAGMIVQAWQDFKASEVGEAAFAAQETGRQVLVETPLVAPKTPPAAVAAGAFATGAISKETIPTAWRGVIDLLIETPQGWWLVDYKTNEHTTEEMLRGEYDAQLLLYREALHVTRPQMRVCRTSLWSTSLNRTIDIDRED